MITAQNLNRYERSVAHHGSTIVVIISDQMRAGKMHAWTRQHAELTVHYKMRSMKFIQNYHNEYTKIEFGMLIVVILYDFHTSHFAV